MEKLERHSSQPLSLGARLCRERERRNWSCDQLATALVSQTAEQERKEAEQICAVLGGLPLALDQAGAYIEENQCRRGD